MGHYIQKLSVSGLGSPALEVPGKDTFCANLFVNIFHETLSNMDLHNFANSSFFNVHFILTLII